MGKDKSEKKEKKEKKEKRSEVDGVKKSKKEKKDKKERKHSKDEEDVILEAAAQAEPSKKEKKEKKEKKIKAAAAESSEEDETADVPMQEAKIVNGKQTKPEIDLDTVKLRQLPKDALVPFANPLADEKQTRKVLKGVKKAAKHKVLKRGVKEVVKAVRKTEPFRPSAAGTSEPSGIVIIAADISPMDVISHIPILCEDHNIPYIFVQSRAELGSAGNTKRPTSVVLVSKSKGKGQEVSEPEFKETYAELVKLVIKAGATVVY